MFVHPDINPIALRIGPIKIYWYGIMYVVAFAIAWGLALLRASKLGSGWSKQQVSDLIFYCAVGVVVGGRLGYMLFYDLSNFVADPIIIFKTWHGGMSFHGGLLGVIISLLLFAKKTRKNFFDVTDFVVPLAHVDSLPRHPSELYECFFEGIILFVIIWFYSAKPKPRLAASSLFLIGYGVFRFALEFFRQPDQQLGFIAFGWLTMGQLLSVPMIITGMIFICFAYYLNGYEK